MNRCWTLPFASALILPLLFSIGCEQTKPVATSSIAAAGNFRVQPQSGGLNEADFRQLWMEVLPVDKGDSVTRLCLSQQDVVQALTPKNVVYTVNKTTGVLNYYNYVNGNGRELFTPVVLPLHIVYMGQSNLEIYKRTTGVFEKSVPLPFAISSDAVGERTELYMGADRQGGELVNIDITRDYVPVVWSLLMEGEVRGAPALYHNAIYVASSNGGIYAVGLDRNALWDLNRDRFDTGGAIRGDVKVDDEGVYVASASGRLICLNSATGRMKWQYIAPHNLEVGPVVTRTSVYEIVPELGLVAISKSTTIAVDPAGKRLVQEMNRSPRWTCAQAVQFVAEDRSYVYVRTANNELWALDRVTGQVRFRGQGTHFSAIATNTIDNLIYAVTDEGVIYCVKPELGPGSPGFVQ